MRNVLHRDEEPPSATTARHVLVVPVRAGGSARVLRVCRDPLGERVVVAFTSVTRLRAVLGVEQEWVRLGAGAVRSLADGAGVRTVLVDPGLAAPPVREASRAASAPTAPPPSDGPVPMGTAALSFPA